jgi:hypothetical protein
MKTAFIAASGRIRAQQKNPTQGGSAPRRVSQYQLGKLAI